MIYSTLINLNADMTPKLNTKHKILINSGLRQIELLCGFVKRCWKSVGDDIQNAHRLSVLHHPHKSILAFLHQ